MQFEHTYALARATPTGALAKAWGTTPDDVTQCAHGKRPMTIREAGALAELHGLKLLDVLTV